MAESPDRMTGIEQRVTELETDVRIHFDIFSGRLDTIRAEGNLHHSELQLQYTSLQTIKTPSSGCCMALMNDSETLNSD